MAELPNNEKEGEEAKRQTADNADASSSADTTVAENAVDASDIAKESDTFEASKKTSDSY